MDKKILKERLLLISYAIILFVFLINYNWLINIFKFIGKVLNPFFIGIIIAFILNIIIYYLEKSIFKKLNKSKRILSIITSLVIIIGLIAILMCILIPQLKNAGKIFIDNIPEYQETIQELGTKIGLSTTELQYFDLENNTLKKEIVAYISDNSDNLLDIAKGFAGSFIGAITNFFVGLVFAIYLLLEKENLKRQSKKLLSKVSRADLYEKILDFASLSNKVFSNFIKVQVLEGCILGILCFIGMLILGLPYAATISVVVGFTALIPVFGSFVGALIGAFLIFMVNPIQSIIFIIFYLILQQIEGNFIYPKVVGNRVNLPSIWVLVAVIVGGSIGGVFGMLLGVPVMSIIYSLLKDYVNDKSKQNKKA